MKAIGAYTIDTGDGWAHAETVIPIAAELANRDAADPDVRRWATMSIRAAGVPRDDVEGEARALLAAVQRDVRYTEDPIERRPDGVWETRELVQSPTATLQLRAGDCIAIATLLAAAVQSVGRIPRFNVVAWEPGQPRHVTVEVQTARGWYTIDPVTTPPRVGLDAALRGAETRLFVVPGVGAVPAGAVLVEPARCGSCGIGADDRPTLDEQAQAKLDAIEREYGDTIRSVSAAADSASAALDALAGATDPASATAAVEAVFSEACGWADSIGAGGVCRAVARGILTIGNWLVQAWPARPLYPEPQVYYTAAALRGFGRAGLSDTEAAAAASALWGAGWFVHWTERESGQDLAAFGDRLLGLRLGARVYPERNEEFLESLRARNRAIELWNRGEWEAGDAVAEPYFPRGVERARAIVDAAGPGGWTSVNKVLHDRIGVWIAAFPWDAIPAELRRAVGLCLFAPRDRWPDDGGVAFLTDLVLRRNLYVDKQPFYSPELIAFVARATGQSIPPGFLDDGEPVEAAPVPTGALRAAFPGLDFGLRAIPQLVEPADPVQVAPAAPPAEASPAELPRTIPEGLTTREAQVLAAIRYYDATQEARRADAAARAYHGIGALPVRLVDTDTEAEILAGLPGAAQLVATTDVRTRARRANYGLSHLVELGRRRVAERLMSWRKARGDAAVDSTVTDGTRAALAADGGFPLGAVPTVAEVAAAVVEAGGGPPEDEPIQVLPAGSTTEGGAPELLLQAREPLAPARSMIPTETGLPAAPGPGVPAVQGPTAPAELPQGGASAAFPEGAPAGATMIAPPGSAEITVRQKADPTLLVIVVLGIYAANRRRRS